MARGNSKRAILKADAMEIVVREVAADATKTMAQIMAGVGRTVETYEYWRKTNPEFKKRVDEARARQGTSVDTSKVPDFPQFCEQYLDLKLYDHQLNMWDVICGRTPRAMHASMQLDWSGELSNNRRIIGLWPPDHGKSTTFTVAFTVWNIYKNPAHRTIIISQTGDLARQFTYAIQRYLLDPSFTELRKLDPPGGWRDPDLPWNANFFYVRGRDNADPDPTVRALGMGTQIYGRRCDNLICDDIETANNVGMYEKHALTITREANSRLRPSGQLGSDDPGGLLLVIGTRVAASDVYAHLRTAGVDDGDRGYTFFAQPAILENESFPKEQWKVLWPHRMGPKQIAAQRSGYVDQRQFQLIYQQNDISEDAPFPHGAIEAAINRQRFPGIMHGTVPNVRDEGMEGLHVVGGIDPAAGGGTSMVVVGCDPKTMRRYVLDVFYERNVHAEQFISKVKELTEKYSVKEWRVESNAFQRFMTQLDALTSFMNTRGVLWTSHHTNQGTKWDADWGVTTLVPLFKSCAKLTGEGQWIKDEKRDGNHLIEIPSPKTPGVQALIQQLKVWDVNVSHHTAVDCVMALWFAEIAAREFLLGRRSGSTAAKPGKFTSPFMMKRRKTWDQALTEILMKDEAYGYMREG